MLFYVFSSYRPSNTIIKVDNLTHNFIKEKTILGIIVDKSRNFISRLLQIFLEDANKKRCTLTTVIVSYDIKPIKLSRLRSDPHLPKKIFLLERKPFKDDRKCFLFHLIISLCSQDIKFLS